MLRIDAAGKPRNISADEISQSEKKIQADDLGETSQLLFVRGKDRGGVQLSKTLHVLECFVFRYQASRIISMK